MRSFPAYAFGSSAPRGRLSVISVPDGVPPTHRRALVYAGFLQLSRYALLRIEQLLGR